MTHQTDKYARLPVVRLHELFAYEPDTGRLTWRFRENGPTCWNARHAGQDAGALEKGGYFVVNLAAKGKRSNYRVHRIVWAMMTGTWPEASVQIDHRDGVRSNNSWSNLRLATATQNCRNISVARGSTGLKGVYVVARSAPYISMIRIQGRIRHLGYFSDKYVAARAYDAAAIEHFGEFAKTNASLGLLG